jgi:hypothetical protein
MSIDILKRQVRTYQTLAFNRYDRLQTAPESLFSAIALTINNQSARENPVRLEEDFFYPEAYAWEDEMVSMPGLARLEYTVPIKGYASWFGYNRVNIGRPGTVARLERILPRLAFAHDRLQIKLAMDVFRTNPLSVTGQNFFADAHPIPGKVGTTYDNKLAPAWVAAGSPTDAEVKALLDLVRTQFATNLTVDAEVVDSSEIDANLLVIVHNATHEAAFRRAKNDDTLTIGSDQVPNPNKGTFRLLRDKRPTSGQENYIEFIHTEPGGPRPVIRVLDSPPKLDAIESNRVSNALVMITMESMFGMKAGDPSTAIQVQPTTI